MPAAPPRGPDPNSNLDVNPTATTSTAAANTTTTTTSSGAPGPGSGSDSGSTTSSAESEQKQMAAAVAAIPTAASRFAQTFSLVYNTEDGAEPIPLQIDVSVVSSGSPHHEPRRRHNSPLRDRPAALVIACRLTYWIRTVRR
jgi:hypothetical protein